MIKRAEEGKERSKWDLYLTENEKLALVKLKLILGELFHDTSMEVILYGSKARGDYDNDSDVDMAVITGEITRSVKRSVMEKIAEIEAEYLTIISPLILTREQFEDFEKERAKDCVGYRERGS